MKNKELFLTTTIGYDDLVVTIHFDYQPVEPETLEYPGCEDDTTINSILTECGTEISGAICGEVMMDAYEKVEEYTTGSDDCRTGISAKARGSAEYLQGYHHRYELEQKSGAKR